MAMKKANGGSRGEKFKFEDEGASLEGYFQGSRTLDINGKEVLAHDIVTEEGTLYSPLGSTDLNSKLEEVPTGARVRITFVKTQKIKGRPVPMKIFDVEYDDEDIQTAPASTGQKAAATLKNAQIK